MTPQTTKKQLSFKTSALIVMVAVLIIGTAEFQALKAKEPVIKPPNTLNSAECVRCHHDPKSIATMRNKEDGTNYLFNPDGTFKDPKLSYLNSYHKKKDAPAKALNSWKTSSSPTGQTIK